jgi:hypothetical protein
MALTAFSTSRRSDSAENYEPLVSFSRPKTSEALIRGSLFAPLPNFVKTAFGEERWPEFLQRVDPVAARFLDTQLDALSWYPFRVITSAVEAIQQMSRTSDAEVMLRRLSRHNLGSPEFMVSKSDQVWEKYYSKGRMQVSNASRGHATVQLIDFPEITPTYSRVVQYAIEAVIEKAGGKLTRSEINLSPGNGGRVYEFSYAWTV